MKVIIPAAGYSTRLQKDKEKLDKYKSEFHPDFNLGVAKSLLTIKGKPILDYTIERILALGPMIDKIFLITNAVFYESFKSWKLDSNCPMPIEIINDKTTSNETRLGGLGDLAFLLKREPIKEDALIIAADNLFKDDLNILIQKAKAHNSNALFVYDLTKHHPNKQIALQLATKFGIVTTDASGRIINFKEKPPNPESTLAATAIYYFTKEIMSKIPEYAKIKPEGPGYIIELAHKEIPFYAVPTLHHWYDIGTIEGLEEADKNF
jgi:glucose-1-phosphate thymidylyltransferase